jgi:hypothetical protein
MATPSQVRTRRARRERAGIGYRMALAALASATAIATGLIGLGVWIGPPTKLVAGMIVALSIAALRDNVLSAGRRLAEPRRERRRMRSQKAVVVALVTIAELRQVKLEDLGVSVFLVQPHGLELERFRVKRRERLVRIVRFRLKDSPQPSDVDWVRGKGVIGKCWEQQRPVHQHLAPLAKSWARKQVTDAAWDQMAERARQGFSRDEFVTTLNKYAEIVAVPIKDEHGGFLGCISVDLAMTSEHAQHGSLLSEPGVEAAIATAAEIVAGTLSQP